MYFDPGFGSMLIQLVVAGVAALGVYFGIMKTKLKNAFSKKKKEGEKTPDDEL